MQEAFLDSVFGSKSKMMRTEWETAVGKTEQWIFNTKKIRQQVDKYI